jgi:GNAT superfamily N-acetyltransferase
MTYRQATLPDINQLAEMRWSFQTEFEGVEIVWNKDEFVQSCREFYKKTIDSGSWLLWVAEQDGRIIANVSIFIVDNIPTPTKRINKWGYLTNTYTHKEFRGKGIGSKLTNFAVSEAKSLKIETIIVWPSEKSTEFYKRIGFGESTKIMELGFD